MKTDTLFYQLLQEFPWIFFELINKPETNLNAYEFIAPEIKQRSFRLDGLFTTKENFDNEPLYFVEVQFYPEKDFYDRIIPSIFLYFGQYKPVNSDWYVIVIFDCRNNDVTIPQRYREIANQRLSRIYLDEIENSEQTSIGNGILKLVVEPEKEAKQLAKNLISRTKNALEDIETQKQVIKLIETIVIYKFPQLTIKEIEIMLNLPQIKETKVYQEALQEGLERGLEQGKLEQKMAMIPLLQELGLSIEQIAERLELDEKIIRNNN